MATGAAYDIQEDRTTGYQYMAEAQLKWHNIQYKQQSMWQEVHFIKLFYTDVS